MEVFQNLSSYPGIWTTLRVRSVVRCREKKQTSSSRPRKRTRGVCLWKGEVLGEGEADAQKRLEVDKAITAVFINILKKHQEAKKALKKEFANRQR